VSSCLSSDCHVGGRCDVDVCIYLIEYIWLDISSVPIYMDMDLIDLSRLV
jgi:hypothetical protein